MSKEGSGCCGRRLRGWSFGGIGGVGGVYERDRRERKERKAGRGGVEVLGCRAGLLAGLLADLPESPL